MATITQGASQQAQLLGPRDCGLLIAIPLSRQRFTEDLTSESKDFVKSFGRGRRQTIGGLWDAYEPYARLALEVVAEARDYGVAVVLEATLADLAAMALRKRVTTLVAHWRAPFFTAQDLERSGELKESDRRAIEQVIGGFTLSTSKDDLRTRLNAFLEAGFEGVEFDKAPMGTLTRYLFSAQEKRAKLERFVPNFFGGGSAVEFADGLRPLREVVDAVPESFAGILDLTVCNSVLLGEEIRKKCKDCLVLVNEERAFMDYRFALYRQAIRCLAQKPGSFIECVLQLRKSIAEKYK